jgi:vacuolar-type H+-ATPase subunit I/STV1
MDKNKQTPVAEQDGEGVTTPVTTKADGASQGGATSPVQKDEEVQRINAELEKYKNDINRMKSSYDRQINDLKAQHDRKLAEYDERLMQAATAGMDEEARKKYETDTKLSSLKRLQEERDELANQLTMRNQMDASAAFFMEAGVDRQDLDFTDLNSLAASGWKAIKAQKEALAAELQALKTKPQSPKKPEPEAPEVPDTLIHNNGTSTRTVTIDDLAKKYANGNRESLWLMVEKGQLPKSILDPLWKE